ncbi:hypothetical protein Pint_31671 [Pistacia integerrima]|uniref:Uncharacterized protein n=1 Tax=Pistacia integerrima TaxID=434235 RepID=A0ACC0XPK1_9ROSI|nr:hypothetical protein Pint_31671 [Pistacia integerrima]
MCSLKLFQFIVSIAKHVVVHYGFFPREVEERKGGGTPL